LILAVWWLVAKSQIVNSALISGGFYLHTGNADFLDNAKPTSTIPKFKESPPLDRSDFKIIGTWSAAANVGSVQLGAVGPLGVWLGLADPKDRGVPFDLRAEILKNGAVIATAMLDSINGLRPATQSPKDFSIAFGSISDGRFGQGDVLSLRVLARISSHGKPNDSAKLRLYYDAANRASNFGASFTTRINTPPVANAGPDQTVFVGDTVTLNGSGSSDADGDPLTFKWAFISVPSGSGAALSNPAAVNPTFVVDRTGSYTIRLIVNDGTIDSVADIVIVSTTNSRPVADAGPDQTTLVGNNVTLDGSKSSDFDGDSLTYHWSFVSQPTGSTATLKNPTSVNPAFVSDKYGD
jgi:hypothetical protein